MNVEQWYYEWIQIPGYYPEKTKIRGSSPEVLLANLRILAREADEAADRLEREMG